MSLNDRAQKYFSNMNSIANRMCTDMEETKSEYEDLWYKLNEDEKEQILNDCIIKPHVSLKYEMDNCGNKGNDSENNYATKIIVDDNCSYKDEHSGPFSFHTKSQRDLTFVNQKTERKVNLKTSISKVHLYLRVWSS